MSTVTVPPFPSDSPTTSPTIYTITQNGKDDSINYEYMTLLVIPVAILCITKPSILLKWWRVLTCWHKRHPQQKDTTDNDSV